MDPDSRGLFRVNLSREIRSSSSNSSNSTTKSRSSSSVSRSSESSSIQRVVDPSPPSTGIYEHADDAESSSTWGIQDMVSRVEQSEEAEGEEEQEQEKQEKQQQQEPLLHTPFDSPPLSLRGDSLSANASCHHSPPRIRPMSELPPTKSLGNVLHSAPTAMKPGEKICHDGMLSFESPTPSQVSPHPPSFPSNISDPLVKSSLVSPYPSPIPKITGASTIVSTAAPVTKTIEVPEGPNLLHGAQCKVCSLCGVTVLQVGTLEEQEKQYREHEESWAHQKNQEMRALLEHGEAALPTKKGPRGNSSVSPTKQKLFDDLTTSPTMFSQKVIPLKGSSSSSSGRYAQFLSEETPTEEQQPMVSPPIIFQPVPHATKGTPSHVQKELFCEGSQQSVFENEEETRHRTCESVPVTVKEKVNPMREVNHRKHELPNQGTNSRQNVDEANSEKQPHGISSSSSVFPNKTPVNEYLLQKKEREMETKLNKYRIKKERHKLLLCFRRWFNLMFVRAMENSSFPRGGATIKEQVKVTPKEQKIPSKRSGASKYNLNSDSTLGIQPVEEKEKNSEFPKRSRRATTIKLRKKPFMEMHVRGVSHLTGSSSTESVRDKESTTDVSWYIHPSSHKKSSPKKGGGRRGSQTSPLLDEKSVADILATLSPSLRSRVGMLFGNEVPHSASFPKTSCVLSQLHSSAMPPQPSSWTSLNVGNRYSDSFGIPIPHTVPHESEVLANEEERKREKTEKEEEEGEKRKRDQQHEQQEQKQEQERQTSLVSQNEAVVTKSLSAATAPQRNSTVANSSQEVDQLHNRTYVNNEKVQSQASGTIEGILHSSNRVMESLDRSPFSHDGAEDPSGNQGDNVLSQDERIFINQRRQRNSSSPSPRRQGGVESERGRSFGVKSSMRGASARPPMMEGREGEKRAQPRLKNRDACNRGSKSEIFRGAPGDCYIYHRGSYHLVRDPLSEIYCDAAGKRLPIYVVRHAASPAVSPMRGRWSPTRPRSPLGPNRLNPYCAVCVARYNLVLVDESMRPLKTTPQRLQDSEHEIAQTPHRSRTRSGRRLVSATNMPRYTTPQSSSEDFGHRNHIGKFPAHHCEHISPAPREDSSRRSNPQRGNPVLGTYQTVLKPSAPKHLPPQQRLNAELHESDHGLRNVLRNISPGEERWLSQQERRLRRRMKSLLWHELPQSRGSRQWVDYLCSLKEVIQMLETLREGRTPDR
ncbi:hypothetical protein LSM04_006638 [Trypanosoma melophagium]|uniref:uncharacterized protein n=1 Tax=Trypanosoma melophagium TaxID=715481 RepID=UPI00351A619C|nr:hypothetical protein LSM04_006638 [Trypanosoma melophagium]